MIPTYETIFFASPDRVRRVMHATNAKLQVTINALVHTEGDVRAAIRYIREQH